MRGFWKTVLSLAVVALIALFIYLFFKAGPVYLLGGFAELVEWICWILIGIATVTIVTNPLRKTIMGYYIADLCILAAWFVAIQLFFTSGPTSVFGSYTTIVYWVFLAIIIIAAIITVVRWVMHAVRLAKHKIDGDSPSPSPAVMDASTWPPQADTSPWASQQDTGYAAQQQTTGYAAQQQANGYHEAQFVGSSYGTSYPAAQPASVSTGAGQAAMAASAVVATSAAVVATKSIEDRSLGANEAIAVKEMPAVQPQPQPQPVQQVSVVSQPAQQQQFVEPQPAQPQQFVESQSAQSQPAAQPQPSAQPQPEVQPQPARQVPVVPATPSQTDWGAWDAWGVGKPSDVEAVAAAGTAEGASSATRRAPGRADVASDSVQYVPEAAQDASDAADSSWDWDAKSSVDNATLIGLLDEDQLLRFVAGSLMDEGYRVKKTKVSGLKRGSAMAAKKGSTRALVICCKNDDQIDENEVSRVYRASKDAKCNGVVMATNGSFTKQAKDFAAKKNVTLWDGSDLQDFI